MGGPLNEAQRAALEALAPFVCRDFYLAGGVAVALRLRHRSSRDLDLFTGERDPRELEESLTTLPAVRVTGRAEGTLHLDVAGVPVSLLRYRYPLVGALESSDAIPVRLASTDDLVCMKLSAIGGRGARRDFWDLHEMLVASRLPLAAALDLFARKYPGTDRGHVVRALAYFADADAEPMPAELDPPRWEAIKRDLIDWVRALR